MIVIASVYLFDNGWVKCFDKDGSDLSDYQGPYKIVRDSVLRDAPESAAFFFSSWGNWVTQVPREEWGQGMKKGVIK